MLLWSLMVLPQCLSLNLLLTKTKQNKKTQQNKNKTKQNKKKNPKKKKQTQKTKKEAFPKNSPQKIPKNWHGSRGIPGCQEVK